MSAWNDILTATKTRVDAITGIYTTRLRRSGDWLDSVDTLPCTFIAPAGEETVNDMVFPNAAGTKGTVNYIYPVAVLLVKAHNRDFTVDTGLITLRQTLRDVLDQRDLTGAATVIDADIDPVPPFSYPQTNAVVDVTGFIVRYSSWEARA